MLLNFNIVYLRISIKSYWDILYTFFFLHPTASSTQCLIIVDKKIYPYNSLSMKYISFT